MVVLKYVLLIVGSYFIGSINFARLLGRLKKVDITKQGSGNPGTMNMIRNQGLGLGILTLLLDMLKGAIPATCGFYLFGGIPGATEAYGAQSMIALYTAGIAAIIGHIWPIYYKFKGGKGVACVLGVFAVANPLAFVIVFVLDIIYLLFFDYGSVFSFIIVTALTVIEAMRPEYRGNLALSLLLFAIFFLIWFAHRQNIFRLLLGRENKANVKASLKKIKKKIEQKRELKRKNSNEMG